MKFTLRLIDWQASAPGLTSAEEWQRWAAAPEVPDSELPLAKCSHLPMMTARRLSSGSRAAVDCGLAVLKRQPVDALVFTSRHGELERNLRILTAIASDQPLSPTDFAMSVHNAAAGSLTIAAAQPLVATSVAAGIDTFQQGLFEVLAMMEAGHQHVLLVDFDGAVPGHYQSFLPGEFSAPYAVALLFAKDEVLSCRYELAEREVMPLPQSMQFLQGTLSGDPAFQVQGAQGIWHWDRRCG